MDRQTPWIANRANGSQKEGEPTQWTLRQRNCPASRNQSVSSDQSFPMDYSDHALDPCIRQVAQLELKPKIMKQPKLFSSKSLSQLVPRALFFKKRKSIDKESLKVASGSGNSAPNTGSQTSQNTFISTKSFPSNAGAGFVGMNSNPAMEHDELDIYDDEVGNNMIMLEGTPEINFTKQTPQSVSTTVSPRHSSRNSITLLNDNCTFAHASLSPIAGSQESRRVSLTASTNNNKAASATMVTDGEASSDDEKLADKKPSTAKESNEAASNNGKKEKKTTERCKAIKNTTLVLRDVKNSIGLRMRAKQESQAFSKLHEEVATPPTKLYSPFNIYTPDNKSLKDSKSRRKLALNGSSKKQANVSTNSTGEDVEVSTAAPPTRRPVRDTPKRRAALQHKLHLLQGSKFAFDSPTGRLRETVKDVEQFQQCIEDISKAIRARGQQR